jgi:hypothetical protein
LDLVKEIRFWCQLVKLTEFDLGDDDGVEDCPTQRQNDRCE